MNLTGSSPNVFGEYPGMLHHSLDSFQETVINVSTKIKNKESVDKFFPATTNHLQNVRKLKTQNIKIALMTMSRFSGCQKFQFSAAQNDFLVHLFLHLMHSSGDSRLEHALLQLVLTQQQAS